MEEFGQQELRHGGSANLHSGLQISMANCAPAHPSIGQEIKF
jgi:hypothetical protein